MRPDFCRFVAPVLASHVGPGLALGGGRGLLVIVGYRSAKRSRACRSLRPLADQTVSCWQCSKGMVFVYIRTFLPALPGSEIYEHLPIH